VGLDWLQRGSLTENWKVNVALLALMEKGILYQLKRKWWDQMDGGGRCAMDLLHEDPIEQTWIYKLLNFLPEF